MNKLIVFLNRLLKMTAVHTGAGTATNSQGAARAAGEQPIPDDAEHQQAWSISFRLAMLKGTHCYDKDDPDGRVLHELIEQAAAVHNLTAIKAGYEARSAQADCDGGPRIVCQITIASVDKAQEPNLPSHFFPGCGSDGAEFRVTEGEIPSKEAMDQLLQEWDGDCYLVQYDHHSGKGYFTMLDCDAPDSGTVISLSRRATG
ncbi:MULTISPECIES: hypothetical protein [Achromobacter]|uniref:Uncharacterized protein n=1 Tax=Achromobacter mucicolens TaxID=1389922 RepID=A0ABM8LKU5_9BURK|nr:MULTISPECIES: hypothetical protein [Achromobacter]AVG43930.1 hypothetical protein MC81_30975 [Achromobacter insolitus]CAB3845323.1 hypothetical protein LMG3410_01482 [Achromobacter aegrifaciens]CAB3914695.1 hypothetical protein LMG3415_05167 [Achromobacter mucicolens]